jgi:ATP-binding cassette subfamily B protein
LILRIVDPQAGTVSFDGVDIRQATVASVRRGSANVLQDCHIIRGTIAENLRFAKADASDEQLVDAARQAGIEQFISKLADGLQTVVDARGSSLSGGQRQGIAIARALVLNPKLLLLDEPTSMLDPITEAQINRVIEQLAMDRTVIMCTHRLESARRMKTILVLHQGAIAEAGSHDQLIARNGLYRSMWDKQQGFSIRADGLASVTPQRLQAIPIFRGFHQEGLRELIAQFESEAFEPGDCVIREGDPGRKFYITVRGTLEVSTSGVDGRPRRLRILQDGDHFGEIALLKSVPRTATVTATANTQCLSLSRERFNRLIDAQPELLRALEESMAERRPVEAQQAH